MLDSSCSLIAPIIVLLSSVSTDSGAGLPTFNSWLYQLCHIDKFVVPQFPYLYNWDK